MRPIGLDQPLAQQAGCGPVHLAVSGIDHQLIRFVALGAKCRTKPVEHAHAAPADDPAIIDVDRRAKRTPLAG